jgi:hypothetical protein
LICCESSVTFPRSLSSEGDEQKRRQKELNDLRERLEQKSAERTGSDAGLFRRGRIDKGTLDQHLNMIDAEAAGLQAEIEVVARVLSPDDREAQFRTAESLLATLRKRLAGTISPEL